MRKISVAITNYNRSTLTIESFIQVLDYHRISEILILDDCSEQSHFNTLKSLLPVSPKIKLLRNDQNLGMSLNKAKAIRLCEEEWVAILDSDNIFTHEF